MFVSDTAAALRQPPAGISTQVFEIPAGRAGVLATLKKMKAAANEAKTDPRIITWARGLVAQYPQKSYRCEIYALHAYVRDGIRYVRDPVGFELVQSPWRTIQLEAGDCDDKATLLAALLESIGHPAEFCAVGFKDGEELSHVYVNAILRERGRVQVIPLETTEPWKPGRAPPGIKSRMRVKL